MKKKIRFIAFLLMAALALASLCSCGKAEEGPDDKPTGLQPAGNVIEKYSKDDTDYSSLPLEDTRIVRLHYRRNDDNTNDRACYDPWNVWAWDMTNGGNGDAYDFTG